MPPEEATWDSASLETPPAPLEAATETVEPPPESPAPAETPTLEETVPPPLEAAPEAARESESPPEPEKETPKDEYTAEATDPPEIAALTTPAAKRWAKRQYQDAKPIRAFLDIESPIQKLGDELYALSESRYFEHVDDVIDHHRDDAAKRLFGGTYDEIKQRLSVQPTSTNGHPTQPTPVAPLTIPTEAELQQMSDEQIAQRFQSAQVAAQQERDRVVAERESTLKADFDTKFKELQTQFDAVNGKFTTQEQKAFQETVVQKQDELYQRVWSVVEDGIRESGLEVAKDDPPKIASLKKAAAKILQRETEPTFDQSDENKKLVGQVVGFAKRGEFHNAFREEDNLKVRARAAFESVKQSDEVKAILDEIESYANQSKATSRTVNPAPPVAGAAAGVTIKPPTTWDEAEKYQGATA